MIQRTLSGRRVAAMPDAEPLNKSGDCDGDHDIAPRRRRYARPITRQSRDGSDATWILERILMGSLFCVSLAAQHLRRTHPRRTLSLPRDGKPGNQ